MRRLGPCGTVLQWEFTFSYPERNYLLLSSFHFSFSRSTTLPSLLSLTRTKNSSNLKTQETERRRRGRTKRNFNPRKWLTKFARASAKGYLSLPARSQSRVIPSIMYKVGSRRSGPRARRVRGDIANSAKEEGERERERVSTAQKGNCLFTGNERGG